MERWANLFAAAVDLIHRDGTDLMYEPPLNRRTQLRQELGSDELHSQELLARKARNQLSKAVSQPGVSTRSGHPKT